MGGTTCGRHKRVDNTHMWTYHITHAKSKRKESGGGGGSVSRRVVGGYGGYAKAEGVGGYHGTSNAASRKSPGPFISSFPHSSPYYKPRLSHGRGPTHTTLPHTRWVSLYNLFTPNAAWSRTVHPRSQPMFTLMSGWARSAATHLVWLCWRRRGCVCMCVCVCMCIFMCVCVCECVCVRESSV